MAIFTYKHIYAPFISIFYHFLPLYTYFDPLSNKFIHISQNKNPHWGLGDFYRSGGFTPPVFLGATCKYFVSLYLPAVGREGVPVGGGWMEYNF